MIHFIRLNLKKIGMLAILLALTACVSTPVVSPEQRTQGQRIGRFSVLVYDQMSQRNEHAVQGGFVWLDQQDDFQLDLTNPLGSSVAQLKVHPKRALLILPSGQVLKADNVDDLVTQALGDYPLPVQSMRYWIKGLPIPNASVSDVQKDSQGHYTHFVQNQWDVQLSDYDSYGPKRLNLQRQDKAQRITARLVVDE